MKTKTYQIKNIDPAFWKRVHKMCLEKDVSIRDFIMNFLNEQTKDFEGSQKDET